ncbi:hypothetical protein SBA3_3770021 [Candidatus Sulfopaludibacter sp. SbA3]|nr:hypothetical protein SBA3_3770021 [Candidatus Sulfopaludibacter sp. SbA3]
MTIPAFGTATVTTAGTSSPQKIGFAIVQSSDASKKVQPMAQIGPDLIPPSVPAALPVALPFDATGTATTTLYLYNPATSGSLTGALGVYDSNGNTLGTGSFTIVAQQQVPIVMSKTAAVFGDKKGTLYVSGSGTVLAMGIRTGSDGRLEMVMPEAVSH